MENMFVFIKYVSKKGLITVLYKIVGMACDVLIKACSRIKMYNGD